LVVKEDRIKYWMSVGALPTDRVQRLLSKVGLTEMPKINEQTKKNKPRAKTLERMKEAEEAAESAAAPVEAAPAEEAPAEKASAEEKAVS
jgi:small subunit ribosomal protein S16